MKMFNCSAQLFNYYKDDVRLRMRDRDEMRDRRDTNRKRLDAGLKKNELPTPLLYKSQGSYAMWTMVQSPENDYDIDDGVYFPVADLTSAEGLGLSSREAKQRICNALTDERFNRQPEVKDNCVRVFYEKGYHVDLPVYRLIYDENGNSWPELASTSWVRSDARDVTTWFNEVNKKKSPDSSEGRQFRRIVTLLKAYSLSRNDWKGRILSGFGVTALAEECYVAAEDRDDVSFFETMVTMRKRLLTSTEISHPVTPGQYISSIFDGKALLFAEAIGKAIEILLPTLEEECSELDALKCWDEVFLTDHFSDQSSAIERAPDEEYIGQKGFLYRPFQAAKIRASVCEQEGYRSGPLDRLRSAQKGVWIEFKLDTKVTKPYEIYWKVRNRGLEAERENVLRGEIRKASRIIEPTAYEGCHYVEAYVVKGGIVVAATRCPVRIS